VARFANFQMANDPGKELSLAAAVMLLVGLTGSLTIRQRRIWVRARPGAEGGAVSVVEVATLPLTRRDPPQDELATIARAGGGPAAEPLPSVGPAHAHAEEPPPPVSKE